MRIIQVMHSHGWGGAESHVVTLSRGLRGLGHAVLFAGPADSWLTESFHAIDIPTRHLRMNGLLDVLSHWQLRRLAQQWQADVVHAHGVRASMYVGHCRAAAATFGTLSTAHSCESFKHMQGCDQVIAVSQAVHAYLVGHGHAPERVITVYNGVPDGPHTRVPAARRALHLGDHEFALCSAGRFVHDKGQDTMVRAVLQSAAHVSLTLIGDADTTFGREVRALAGADPRIRFLGFRDDVSALLPAFDAYLCASSREAFGLSLAEALAAGLPVVATAVGGVPEVVADGVNGLLVPVKNADAVVANIAAAIARLASDAALCSALGSRSRTRYLQLFSAPRMVASTADVYAGLAPAHGSVPLRSAP